MYYLVMAAVIAGLDQAFKYWVVANIAERGYFELLPGFMHLTFIKNTGASFSILEGQRWLLLGITVVALVLLVWFIFKSDCTRWERVCLASVMGGAVGNAIDRVLFGYVVDMFEVEFVRFAVFNVADCFIVCGGILFCILYIIRTVKEEKDKKSPGCMPELKRLAEKRVSAEQTADGSAEEVKDENTDNGSA